MVKTVILYMYSITSILRLPWVPRPTKHGPYTQVAFVRSRIWKLTSAKYMSSGPSLNTLLPKDNSLIRTELFGNKYSGPSLKGHSLERTPLYKGHKYLAASTMNVCNAPSHQRTPL